MKNLKAKQREQVILEFGILIQPYEELLKRPTNPVFEDYRIAVAKVSSGDPAWRKTVKEFTTFSDDLFMGEEHRVISHVPERLMTKIRDLLRNSELTNDLTGMKKTFSSLYENAKKDFFQYLQSVPVTWEPEIFDANTPFSSYLKIKQTLMVINQRIEYFDRYLKPDFYTLFLKEIDRSKAVTIVTTKKSVNAVSAVSNLAKQEFSNYKLVEVDPSVMHDRNLRVDNKIFTLGPGVDKAGIALTNFGLSDSSPTAHKNLDNIVQGGKIVHQS